MVCLTITKHITLTEHDKYFRIALLPGDGIGPDVMAEAVKVLRAVEPNRTPCFEFTELSVGAGEYLRSGDPLAACDLRTSERRSTRSCWARWALPDVRWPDGTEMTPQIDLREKLDLYLRAAADPALS